MFFSFLSWIISVFLKQISMDKNRAVKNLDMKSTPKAHVFSFPSFTKTLKMNAKS